MILLKFFLLFLCLMIINAENPNQNSTTTPSNKTYPYIPRISPIPQPFLPSSSPLTPFINTSAPKLSGKCALNFTASPLISTTAIDCYGVFAPLLANVICCPQVEATLAILIGHSSKTSGALYLNRTSSRHCLSDFKHVLSGLGVASDVSELCSVLPSNLTEGSCPVKDVAEVESVIDGPKVLKACRKIDPVRECCDQTCQNALMDASSRLSLKVSDSVKLSSFSSVNSCRDVVLRWLASKLDSSTAKEVLRGLSNCQVNKVCPLILPQANHVAQECGNNMMNKSLCCNAMDSYIGHLQKQSLITNLQALHCATTIALKLKKLNVTRDVFRLCHITLKDFTLQVAKQESGCLLQSLPSDATLDKINGVGFTCDLNDNILAPWPSSEDSVSLCSNSVKIPALPAAASAQSSFNTDRMMDSIYIIIACAIIAILL